MRRALNSIMLIVVFSLAACSDSNSDSEPVEIIEARQWQEEIVADGEIKAAASTQLNVPGTGWDERNLVSMVANGSMVGKGQTIAIFDSVQSRTKLSQAETDLLRKELLELGIQSTAELGRAELSSDSAKVSGDLNLSQRYANANLQIFAQNKILDTLVDIGFLNQKQNYLKWKNNQIDSRSRADQAVVESQKESVNLTIAQQRKSLSALELKAPHEGVFLLKPRWDGSFPQVGSKLWAGEEFGSLPDLEQQVAKFSIAEGAAFGLKEGQTVKVRLSGTGTELNLKLTKLGKTASTKSKESPVKYSDFEANIGQDLVRKHALTPGQAITGRVVLFDANKVLTVPNIALVQEGTDYFVYLKEKSSKLKQKVELGLRGQIRSEVKAGLRVGAKLVLVPEKKEDKS
ncbi:efflux RND transporter periplasmic adaptor subunit [Undibacterium baiyunense]|uniref:Secretion protein HlyD n=1 Tax=Undibacterium baiyunense TaxID=2828731 RepID=A0A941DI35_9BURK|nr:secretion protein HlyD [Undibacterium baiyunense]MBR7746637.1 secretion protein HlyD [Undibacterium baiyunense]